MQEMVELSKTQPPPIETPPKAVSFKHLEKEHSLPAGPAQFGRSLTDGFTVTGEVVLAEPKRACKAVKNGIEFWGKIVIVERGDCMFVGKSTANLQIIMKQQLFTEFEFRDHSIILRSFQF